MPAIFTYALLTIPFIGAYAMFALGVTVIYRASRVLNLAHGAMATVPAYIAYSLARAGVPILVALLVAVAFGAVLGVGVEVAFVRRLRRQGPTAQTVGTVAVTGVLVALVAKIWGTKPLLAPGIFPHGTIRVGQSGIRGDELGLFLTAGLVAALLFAFFRYTDVGLAMRGAAQNRRAASLMGIDPDAAAMAAWAMAGGLAALGGTMLAAATTHLDPYDLSLQVLPAFVGALLGGLESLPGALWGSAVAGLAFGIVPYFAGTPLIGSVVRYSGAPQLALTILALVVMGLRGRRITGAEAAQAGLAASVRPFRLPEARTLRRAMVAAAAFIGVWPLLVPFSVLGTSLLWIQLALAGISLVVLTGWVGQISLAQASFVGIAAVVTGLASKGWGLGFPETTVLAAVTAAATATILGVVALRVRGLYLAVATLIFAWMCDTFLFRTPWFGQGSPGAILAPQRLGNPAGIPFFDLTEPRTLFWLAGPLLGIVVFCLANLRDTKTGRAFFAVRGSEMAAASLGINVVRTKLVAFAIAGAIAGVSGNLLMVDLRTLSPELFFFTVSLQYLAIAVVGGLGSLGGALAAAALFAALNELFFRVSALSGWLEVVSSGLLAAVLLAYPGGLAAVPETVERWRRARAEARAARAARAAAAAPAGAPGREAPRAAPALAAVRGALVRAVVRPLGAVARAAGALDGAGRGLGGARRVMADALAAAGRGMAGRVRALATAAGRLRERAEPLADDWLAEVEASRDGRAPSAPSEAPAGDGASPSLLLGTGTHRRERPATGDGRVVLEATGVTVRFGGLTAVDDATLAVREGTVTGLIGPNGAGKTTLFNAILGLNDPVAGRISIFGRDATRLPPHERARMGVARTFQVLQLFSELTVFDNLLVATHQHNPSGLLSNLLASDLTVEAELAARRRVRRVLAMLGLEDIADHGVRGLPFGTLRMVELGRALVTGARLILLDEPASGLNEAETDRLGRVIRALRDLGISVLLIEHDIRMVVGVCDEVYVLDQGRMIARGTPAEIQRDPRVVAAYLGAPAGAPEPAPAVV
jgi:ABC-type branched-subunit amino acid transport system ATPase component/branched-subunit amino acid ABC-type transport system permease component